MNKIGQITVGMILVAAIIIIVGLVLLGGIYPFIGTTTGTMVLVNRTVTGGGGGVFTDAVGQELLSTPIVTNRTGQQVVGDGNYTIGERVSTVDGLKRIYYEPISVGNWNTTAVNLSYSYGAEGYVDDLGGRSMVLLIPILAAVALLIAIIAMTVKEKFF